MIPPLTSNTLSGEDLNNLGNSNKTKTDKTENNVGGRPEKEDSQKSEKTIQNKESMK